MKNQNQKRQPVDMKKKESHAYWDIELMWDLLEAEGPRLKKIGEKKNG